MARMKNSTSEPETTILRQKRVDCPLPQAEEFRYPGSLNTRGGRVDEEIARRFGAAVS